jgi:prophage regulatory protein
MKLISFEELSNSKGIRYSRVHLMRLVKAGAFPKPVEVGAARVAWVETEVDDWILAKMSARSVEPAKAGQAA